MANRRSLIHKAVGLAALGVLSSVMLERVPVPVSAATAGDVAFSDGSSGLSFDHLNFFWDSIDHRLGIGTTNPGAVLHVIGNTILQPASDSTSHVQIVNSTGTPYILFDSISQRIASPLNRNLSLGLPGGGNYMQFTKGPGNTGIGTNTIILYEQVGSIDSWNPFWNGIHFGGHYVTESSVQRYPRLAFYSRSTSAADPTDYQWVLSGWNTDATAQSLKFQSRTTALQTGESQGDIRFSTSVDPAMTIARSGNVGVGTTSPSQKLTVAGDVGQTVSANGMVKAAVLVNGNLSVIRSFNNLPGGGGPTVSQPLGPGTYEVNFGTNVAQRFFTATLLSGNSTDPGGAADGQILVSTRDGNSNAVFVRTNDTTGTSTNRSFYLMIF